MGGKTTTPLATTGTSCLTLCSLCTPPPSPLATPQTTTPAVPPCPGRLAPRPHPLDHHPPAVSPCIIIVLPAPPPLLPRAPPSDHHMSHPVLSPPPPSPAPPPDHHHMSDPVLSSPPPPPSPNLKPSTPRRPPPASAGRTPLRWAAGACAAKPSWSWTSATSGHTPSRRWPASWATSCSGAWWWSHPASEECGGCLQTSGCLDSHVNLPRLSYPIPCCPCHSLSSLFVVVIIDVTAVAHPLRAGGSVRSRPRQLPACWRVARTLSLS